MPRPSRAVLALLLALGGGPGLLAADPGRPARYVVFTLDATGVVRPEFHAVVALAAERRGRSEEEVRGWLASAGADREHVAVRLRDAAGRVAFRDLVAVPRWLRTEAGLVAEAETGPGAGEWLAPMAGRAFVVRVPWLPASRLEVILASASGADAATASPTVQEFDLDALAADSSLPLARFRPRSRFLTAPAPTSGNRVDLVVMGDGYAAAQSAKFASDAASVMAAFFGISPYSVYQNYFNLSTLFTPSNQSGADHPPYAATCAITYPPTCCSDPRMQTDPLRGTFVDTAFDAAYCSANTHRLVTVTYSKVLAAAAAAPDWDEILVVVNDSTYGGSGGAFSVVSTNANAVDVARHEFGHTFSHLADEYTTPYPGFPACSDLAGLAPCEANATDQTNRALLKWAPWVLPTTPVPTPDTAAYDSAVGLFAGARYLAAGMYRPKRSCLMNTLGVPFCPVCSQEFVLRLYRGGWGVPASGIDLVEPGSESPSPGVVSFMYPGSRTFTVSLLQPAGGPPVALSWSVNGAPVPGATAPSYTFTPPGPGRYPLLLTVRDATALVQPTMAGSSLQRTRSWTVDVGPLADLSITQRDDGSAKDGQPLTYTLVAANAGPDAAAGATVADTLPAQITGASWTCSASAGSSCPATGVGNVNALVSLAVSGAATFTVTGTVAAGSARQIVNTASIAAPASMADVNPANNSAALTTPVARAVKFHTVTPCRLADTRATEAPALGAGASRTFGVAGRCQVPASAWAVSVNLTVTQATAPGNLRAFPAGIPLPSASSLNYGAGQTRGNNMVLSLNAAGEVAVYCGQGSGTTHFILDVNGYFE